MITPMKKYTFLVMASRYEHFLEQIREAGVVHITLKASGLADDEDLQSAFAEKEQLEHIIKQGAPDQLIHEKTEVEDKIQSTRREAERMAVWGDFDTQQLQALQQAGYTLYYYTCASSKWNEEWGVRVADERGKTYFVSMQPVEDDAVTEEQLNAKSSGDLYQDIDALNGLLVAAQARIEAWQLAHLEEMQAQLADVNRRIDWKKVTLSSDSMAEGALKLVEGFCPVEHTAALDATLATLDCYYESEDPQPEDATPIQLKNNWFTKLFECLTGMYGLPNYGEFDPTPILGPFFLLFFSLCIGDAGYGLLLILIGYLIHRDKLKIAMFEGMGPIIMALGVGSTVIGYMMGGFFGINLYEAAWFPESAKAVMFNNLGNHGKIGEYDVMMVLALIIGIVHICLAMTVKAICYTRRFGFKQTVSTWGWLVLILGGLIVGVLAMTHVLDQEVTKLALITIGAVSALGIFIFNTPGRNPLINIGAGLWDTYGMATGILGDVLSYIRLYALGLAGGMLGMAFNQLGEMVLGTTPNVGTWIGFIVIVTFGHVLNLLMACLGAFVHPLRLTFVEYFKNAGYEGSGKQYQPFKK
ncbi:MAG: ATPase V [Paludibacteraceae bacterium]|nr:ATPase V [Paludibacteraceae bacterium]